MRLRTDEYRDAGRKRAIELGAVPDPRSEPEKTWYQPFIDRINDPSFEAAQPGDIWRLRWVQPPEQRAGDPSWAETWRAGDPSWPVAGYAITCPDPACFEGVHDWDTANNCSCRGQEPGRAAFTDGDGHEYGAFMCCHYGSGSCWQWSGSVETGDLTATPSLFAQGAHCGWHGWLRNGQMVLA